MDAERSSGAKVMLKRVALDAEELDIALYISSKPRSEDPRNCCVPILDVILIPACETHALIVTPLLYEHVRLPFRHSGELLEMAVQLSKVGTRHKVHHITNTDSSASVSSFYTTTISFIGMASSPTEDGKLTQKNTSGTSAIITL